jgi:hypothetical protein
LKSKREILVNQLLKSPPIKQMQVRQSRHNENLMV